MRRVLVVGAGGPVGAAVAAALGGSGAVEHLRLLVAPGSGVPAPLAAALAGAPARVEAVAGDPRLPRFGLEPAAWDDLAGWLDAGFHCARRERYDDDPAAARDAHLRPLDGWLDLMARNPAARLHHLSTALVGGRHPGLWTEFDLDRGQRFRNAFEESLCAAERRLRASPASPRITVYRPSHVVAGAVPAVEPGAAPAGARALLAALAGGAAAVPGDPAARVDFVPAGFVAAAVVALAGEAAAAGATYHLVAGWRGSLTVARLAELIAGAAGRRRSRLVPQLLAGAVRLAGAASRGRLSPNGDRLAAARDYLRQGPVFDDYLARTALSPHGLACPPAESFLAAAVAAAGDL